jgi:signal transduction histidine kinase
VSARADGPGGWDGHRGWGRRGHGPPWTFVAVVLLAVQLIGSTAAGHRQPDARSLDAAGYLLLVLGPLAWLFLRRSAEAVCAAAVGAAAIYLGVGYPSGPVVASAGLALLVAVARGRRLAAWLIAAGGYGLLVALGALTGHPLSTGRLIGFAVWLVVVLLVGEGPRYRAEQFAAARRARRAETEVAASAERLALARDLHDTVGHSLSMIAVQAGVALHLLDEHPEQARPALTAIRTASREALEEVRSTLAVLRQDGDSPNSVGATGMATTTGLARMPELVQAARLGGLRVVLAAEPLPDKGSAGLPPAVDAAAYRVVQEALTNVTRHAGATTATVTVRRSAAALQVEVVDDGRGSDGLVEGRGLLGMRERAAALQGVVQAGNSADGGFRIAVQFPLDNGSGPS